MENQYIKLSDLRKVPGIGEKTIERIKETLLQNRCTNTDEEVKYNPNIDLKLNKFYVAESVEFMKANMPDNFVDLTVTSPPYDNLRDYKGFEFNYKAMLEELYRVTKSGGVVVWIVNDATVNGSETGTSFKQALYAKEVGFNLHDTMIWKKTNPIPLTHNRYEQHFEYMFVFSKGSPKTFNPIKIPCVTKGQIRNRKNSNKEEGSAVRNRNEVTVTKSEKIKGNVWEMPVSNTKYNHPAIFPEKLAEDHILSWSHEGDIVFDPMCGSGTTCKMAYLNKRNFIGIDISEEYINNICKPRLHEHGWSEMA